jgi:GcrA cell cycle regulator
VFLLALETVIRIIRLMNQIAPAHPNPQRPPPPAQWPDARVEALKRAWREGLSASQIAARLGDDLTRSAVIGKLHRLGVSGGRKPSAPRLPLAPSPPRSVGRPALTLVTPGRLEPILDAPPISAASGAPPFRPGPKYLRDMTARECRFGLGDPGPGAGAFQLFCAAPTSGHAYCAHHRAIAILPPRSAKEQKVIKAELEALLAAVDRKSQRARRPASARP